MSTMNASNPSRHRRVLPLIGLLTVGALGLGLTGCAASTGGQTTEQAIERVEQTPGVSTATVKMSNFLTGFTRYWTMRLSITVDDGYQIGNPDAALEWALKTGLSINDVDQKSSVFVGFFDEAGAPIDQDWASSIDKLGFDVTRSSKTLDSGYIAFSGDLIAAADFGPRPGPVPQVPEDAFVAK